jgi:murein L,D-transpeptidase YafK
MNFFSHNKILKVSILTIASGLIILFYHWNYAMSDPLSSTIKADRIVVYKSLRILELRKKGKILKTYSVSLGTQPIGTKEYEGDRRTPEGIYFINGKNPSSDYYKNLGISYPNNKDRKHARQLGKATGGDVKIHGLRNDMTWLGKCHRFKDWTHGCIAVTNGEMEEIYNAVEMKTTIEILP